MNSLFKNYIICELYLLCLLDIASKVKINAESEGRYLVFPPQTDFVTTRLQLIIGLGLPMDVDVSTIIGYVVKYNYLLPSNASMLTEPYVRYERSIDTIQSARSINSSDVYGLASRWEIYRMIESSLHGFTFGKSCLLLAICEVVAVPFQTTRGIFSQLLQAFFTPSTSQEQYLENTDQEYQAAEEVGKNNPEDCSKIFYECEENILDYFTEITYD